MHSVLHVCPDWPVISIYTLRCLLSTIHACGSIQFIHLSALRPPIRVMANDQKQSEGSSVPAEVGQTSSGDNGGNSAAVDQVFSRFKDFRKKKIRTQSKLSESIEPNLSQMKKLSQEGRQRIRKRQKLIKADKSKDGW